MDAVIVDTNVIAIANRKGEHASLECIERCHQRLRQILSNREKVVVDDGWQIFGEYAKYVDNRTPKWIGDIFVKTLLQKRNNPAICEIVHITPVKITDRAGGGRVNGCSRVHITPLKENGKVVATDFAEFPNKDAALAAFHKKDRKFIAVALAYQQTFGQTATLLLAIDRGWLNFIDALAVHGVAIDFLCEADIQRHRRED